MKQSIYEGFTLDVLKHYTTYKRYFKVLQSGEDVELPEGKVKKELVNFVDSHPETIRQKVSIILDHFVNKPPKKSMEEVEEWLLSVLVNTVFYSTKRWSNR
jgi:type I restriction enzyme, R subunit